MGLKRIKKQSGQASVEAVLLLALLISLGVVLTNQFESNQIISNLVSGPWRSIDGMIRHGSWQPAGQAIQSHPHNRKVTYDSDET